MKNDKDKKIKTKYNVETGFSENGLPYARMGNKTSILINIEALSFKHEPPSGFQLKSFIKTHKPFMDNYTVYLIGRKPNLPHNYLMNKMAADYAELIKDEFKRPVDVMGVSTGGQIAHYLAADYPNLVRKVIIISAAYRLSQKGLEIERKSADYFKQEAYGKSLAAMNEFIFRSRFWRAIAGFFIRLLANKLIGNVRYPNDFLVEVQADREMNFKERLKEIKAPTLIISGKDDIGYTEEDVRETAEGILNAELKLYDGYGHNLTMRNWKQVAKDINVFLQK